jgi:cell division protein FtsB
MVPTKTKKRKRSYILTVGLLGLLCYFMVSWVSLQDVIQQQEQAIDVVVQKREELIFENAEKKRILATQNSSEYLERKARVENGVVLPGERIYYDATPGSN